MNNISQEYYKQYRISTVFLLIWAALISFVLFFVTGKNDDLLVFKSVASGIFVLYAVVITVITLIQPFIFKKRVQKLPGNEMNEIQGEKFTKIGKRRFYENFVLYFYGRKIHLVKFSEIKSLEPKGNKIRLVLQNGKKAALTVEPEENSAMLAAALKSKNPEISVIINGKVIEKNDTKGETK